MANKRRIQTSVEKRLKQLREARESRRAFGKEKRLVRKTAFEEEKMTLAESKREESLIMAREKGIAQARRGGIGRRTVSGAKRTIRGAEKAAMFLERGRQAGVSLTTPGFRTATGVTVKKRDPRAFGGPQPFLSSAFGLRNESEGSNIANAIRLNDVGNGTTLVKALRGKKKRDDPFVF